MQSSYNVIKNTSVKNTGLRQIVTNAESETIKAECEENAKNHIESYENLARNIVENARRQAEHIKIKAFQDVKNIEEEAFFKAEQLKNEAYKKGYEEGFNEAYPQAIEQATAEGNAIIASAEELLQNAKAEYESYLQNKAKDINDLIAAIARAVLKKEVQAEEAINSMILEALEASKKSSNFIIRCSTVHVETLKAQANNWKEQLGFLGDIFILGDSSLEAGNAVIDKGNGKIIVGIDYALERIEDILKEKE